MFSLQLDSLLHTFPTHLSKKLRVPSGLQCEPVADLNKSFNTSVSLDSPPWEAAVLIGMLLAFRLAVYIALRKKTQ